MLTNHAPAPTAGKRFDALCAAAASSGRDRHITVLVIHGIGQQRRGECAGTLARSLFWYIAGRPSVPWAKHECPDDSGGRSDYVEQLAWLEEGGAMTHLTVQEVHWGPLAVTPVRLHEIAAFCGGALLPRKRIAWPGWRCGGKWVLDAAVILSAVVTASMVVHHLAIYAWEELSLPSIPSMQSMPLAPACAALAVAAVASLWFAVHYLGDVIRYARADEYSPHHRVRRKVGRRAQRALRRVLSGSTRRAPCDELVVVAHSLGAVVAADALLACARQCWWQELRVSGRPRVRLITAGAPLARFSFFALQSPGFPSQLPALQRFAREHSVDWTNLYFLADPVADIVPGATNVRLPSSLPLLCHTRYLQHRAVAQLIVGTVTSETSVARDGWEGRCW